MTVVSVHLDDLKDVELYLIDQNVGYYKLDRTYKYWASDFYQELSIMSQKHATFILLKYRGYIEEKKYPIE